MCCTPGCVGPRHWGLNTRWEMQRKWWTSSKPGSASVRFRSGRRDGNALAGLTRAVAVRVLALLLILCRIQSYPEHCAIRTATYLTVKYPRMYEMRRAGSSRISQDR
jgi:hypothetical protein